MQTFAPMGANEMGESQGCPHPGDCGCSGNTANAILKQAVLKPPRVTQSWAHWVHSARGKRLVRHGAHPQLFCLSD